MLKIQLPSLLPLVFLLAIPTLAFKVPHIRQTTDETAYNRTTTCLMPTWGGCCLSYDSDDGLYTSCSNATLAATSVPWTGEPSTETANEWACAELESAEVVIPTCCKWQEEMVNTTLPGGAGWIELPMNVMACQESNEGISRRRGTSIGKEKRWWLLW